MKRVYGRWRRKRHRHASDHFWPIVLKKSAMVSTAEKYAIEIEIFTFSRRFWAQISRSGAQKRRFQRSICGQSGRTDFFNTIGRLLPVAKGSKRLTTAGGDSQNWSFVAVRNAPFRSILVCELSRLMHLDDGYVSPESRSDASHIVLALFTILICFTIHHHTPTAISQIRQPKPTDGCENSV